MTAVRIELIGGPADGMVVAVQDHRGVYRFPLAASLTFTESSTDFGPEQVAEYRERHPRIITNADAWAYDFAGYV